MPHLIRVDLGEVDYDTAVREMAGWADERRAGVAPDRLFLLSHPPVITYGRRTPPGDLPADLSAIPAVMVDRGGNATYHGPGQLVGYLVMDLRRWGPVDVVRWLELGLIDALESLGFAAHRRDTPPGSPSLVGVWTPGDRKVASIGMRIRGGVTTHGFALNISTDLAVFERFVACSLDDVAMTSLHELAAEQGVRPPSDAEVRDAVATGLSAALVAG
ncbi:putative lipoate-protein ligase [Actinoplanes missouriensis 431]|uniref:Octanoyltransferase n=1 Tax=Actinoplanes missouriensis (strain ATCC 14538 / DSM 43046 / CBS 188.64 / JCM 3121 / NBRC 102363 / NCIMB 12654 / NRRL B-3342 / UNCC 431) TaxID=512565 RepID=I0H6B3_ACTM4|nr:lipoyl(octanoyl) transferase LipB [Actinoplanes missouriensis]BAL88550.1 putative lipoate-protein ligase [Actinoplanes missouriensis 431]